jgi:hypothetical protein
MSVPKDALDTIMPMPIGWGWCTVMVLMGSGCVVVGRLLEVTGAGNGHFERVHVEPLLVRPGHETDKVMFLNAAGVVVGIYVAAGGVGVAGKSEIISREQEIYFIFTYAALLQEVCMDSQ